MDVLALTFIKINRVFHLCLPKFVLQFRNSLFVFFDLTFVFLKVILFN